MRVFFLDLPHAEKTPLLFMLLKGESEDLSIDEKKVIREMVLRLKQESQP